jgi:hypothetical protein
LKIFLRQQENWNCWRSFLDVPHAFDGDGCVRQNPPVDQRYQECGEPMLQKDFHENQVMVGISVQSQQATIRQWWECDFEESLDAHIFNNRNYNLHDLCETSSTDCKGLGHAPQHRN